MDLKDFSAKPCSTELAFEFLPKKPAKLDLAETAKKLKNSQIEIVLETPVFLALRLEGKNISIFKSGKIMVKETRKEDEARAAAEKLVKKLA